MIKNSPCLVVYCLKIQRGQDNTKRIILDGSHQCSFTLEAGHFYYLSGESGVGKSSLLWSLARLYPLVANQVQLNNIEYHHIPIARWRAEVALLFQKTVIFANSIRDNLLYPFTFQIQKQRLHERKATLPNHQTLQKELNSVGLGDISLEREALSLSGGQQARLALVRLLLTHPQIILADEPMAGIDKVSAQLVLQRLQQFCQQQGTVILTDHHFSAPHDGKMILDGKGKLVFSL